MGEKMGKRNLKQIDPINGLLRVRWVAVSHCHPVGLLWRSKALSVPASFHLRKFWIFIVLGQIGNGSRTAA